MLLMKTESCDRILSVDSRIFSNNEEDLPLTVSIQGKVILSFRYSYYLHRDDSNLHISQNTYNCHTSLVKQLLLSLEKAHEKVCELVSCQMTKDALHPLTTRVDVPKAKELR